MATAVILVLKSVMKRLKRKYKLNRRPSQSKDNSVKSMEQIKRREGEKSSVTKVEYFFGVVKWLGYEKITV